MTSPPAEGSLGAWLRRLPTYLYLVDLLPGKRVLEVGCGLGYGAEFLANHGASRVVGVDRSLRNITDARVRHRQTNLEFRCEEPGSIELDDATFDCIFVPDGIEILRRTSVLGELRRLLAAGGHLVLFGPSADRRGSAAGGASFYEFRDRLERFFAPVRMVAQAPFIGFSLVEYGSGAGAIDDPLDTHLDTSLLELTGGEPEACDYVAVCGGAPGRARGYAVIQVPERDGLDAAATAVGARATERPAEPDPAEIGTSPGPGARDALLVHELRLRLETAIADRAHALTEADEFRAQAADHRTQADAERERARDLAAQLDDLRIHTDEMRQHLAELADRAEAPSEGPSPSEQIAEALAAHRDAVRSLEIAVEEGEAYAEELRADLEQVANQAETEQRARRRAEARAERLEGELREWRTRASTAEGKLLRLSRAAGNGQSAPPVSAPVRIESPDSSVRLAQLEAELARARRDATDAAAEVEALRAEAIEQRERTGNGGAAALPAPAPTVPAPAASAPPPANTAAIAASFGRDVARRLVQLELAVESSKSLIHQVETGLVDLDKQVARDAAERAPSAWAAHRDQQLRELAAELGIKDAEIMILHIGVSALRARMRELVGAVRGAAGDARGRPATESAQLLEQLGERAATFEEQSDSGNP
jgi:SAM-dependent methyltransferase